MIHLSSLNLPKLVATEMWLILFAQPCSGADQRNHRSSASLAFMREIHHCPMDSPHKAPVSQIFFIWWHDVSSTGQVTTWLYLSVIGVNLVFILIFPVYTAEVYPTSTRAQMYGIILFVGRILSITGPFFFNEVNIMGWCWYSCTLDVVYQIAYQLYFVRDVR